LGVEVGEGFIEEEALGFDDEGAGEGDALLLAAGHLVDGSAAEAGELDHFEGFLDAFFDFGFGDFSFFEAEGDVLADGEVWPEGVALEDHGCLAFVGRHGGDVFLAEEDAAAGGGFEAGDAAEECGFSTAGRAEEEEQLAGGDFQRNAVERADGSEGFHNIDCADSFHG